MAVCLECQQPMSQTEAVCPKCGEDYVEPTQGAWQVVMHQSRLTDLFWLMAVAAFFSVGLSTLLPTFATPLGPVVFGILCGICAQLLGEAAPLWTRILSICGIVGILFYPLLVVWMFANWLLSCIF